MYLILSDFLNVTMVCFCLVMLVYTCLHYWKWGGFMMVIGFALGVVTFSLQAVSGLIFPKVSEQLKDVLWCASGVLGFAMIAFMSSGGTLAYIRQKYPQEHPEPGSSEG